MVISVPNNPPATVSQKVCILPSILLCATSTAIKYANVDATTFSPKKVIAVAVANASAVWPLGIPPFKGVPVAVIAFTTTTAIKTKIIQINVKCIWDCLILFSTELDKSVNLS